MERPTRNHHPGMDRNRQRTRPPHPRPARPPRLRLIVPTLRRSVGGRPLNPHANFGWPILVAFARLGLALASVLPRLPRFYFRASDVDNQPLKTTVQPRNSTIHCKTLYLSVLGCYYFVCFARRLLPLHPPPALFIPIPPPQACTRGTLCPAHAAILWKPPSSSHLF